MALSIADKSFNPSDIVICSVKMKYVLGVNSLK
jgi:hypothetical protein